MNNTEKRIEITILYNANEIEKVFDEAGTELTKQDNIYIQLEDDMNPFQYVKDSKGNIKKVEYDNVVFIRNAKELNKFRDDVNAGNTFIGWTIMQIADIDMSEECSEEIGFWTPIGSTAGIYFEGIYEGGNHSISNLYLNNSNQNNAGLFGKINGGKIYNLSVSGKVTGNTTNGGICGYAIGNGVEFVNCKNNVVVNGYATCGGIVGFITNSNNFKIINCENNSNVTTNQSSAGGVVGYAYNISNLTIQNCTNNTTITANIYYAGGICGYISNESVLNIKQCKNVGNIIAKDGDAGGIVGSIKQRANVNINECCNLGEIVVTNNYSSGGCVGNIVDEGKLTISNSYNMGYIGAGKGSLGGILGNMDVYNSSYGTPYATIKNCYNAGVVKRVGTYGGILGWSKNNSWFSLSNNYWELGKGAIYGIGINSSNTGATPVYAATLKTYASKLGSAYSDDITPNINIGYPILEWEKQMLPICAVVYLDEAKENIIIEVTRNANSIVSVKNEAGENLSKVSDTEAIKYTESITSGKHTYTIIDDSGFSKIIEYELLFIDSVESLVAFRDSVNAGNSYEGITIIQTADLDLSSVCGANIGSWTPIGSTAGIYFKGTYDGENYSINNIYINNSNQNNTGLFGKINGGKVYNLSVSGKVTGNTTNGGICGYAIGNGTEFVNCKNNVVVNGYTTCGGIVGCITNSNNFKIINCENNSNITSNQYNASGMVGYVYNISNLVIQNCKNTGRCYSAISNVGGIVSAAEHQGAIYVKNCYNTGTQETAQYAAGGIIGSVSIGMNAIIENCYNMGSVTANIGSDGGILGNMDVWDSADGDPYAIINNCYNAGYIAKKGAYGGILGYTKTTGWYSLTNNYWETGKGANYGNWRGSSNAGATSVSAATLKGYASNLGSAYRADTSPNVNGGYPILKWQVGE